MKNLLIISGLISLLSSTANANSVLDGVWENYTLGTSGTWSLSYQKNVVQTSFAIDFDGDFLGNSYDPEVLELVGSTEIKGDTALRTVGHSVFGDVSATINRKGDFMFRADDVPGSEVESVVLNGKLSENDFVFLHDIQLEGGDFTYGFILTSVTITPVQMVAPHPGGLEFAVTVIPLPSTLLLFVSGLGLLFTKRA